MLPTKLIIIKGWLHCLTSESKGRFHVNNILIFSSAWYLIMAQIQFSLIKKEIGRLEHSLLHMAIHTNDFELRLASIIRFIPLYFTCNMYNCSA